MSSKKKKVKHQPVKKEPVEVELSEKPWFRFWPENVRKHIDFPEIPLYDLLGEASEKFPDQTALTYFDRGMTYGELKDLSGKLAAALSVLGVKQGEKVALFLPNIPQFVISYFGTIRIGAIETAISPLYKEREVEYQLNDSEAETVVVLDVLYPILERVSARTKVKRVIVTSMKEYMPMTTAFLGSMIRKIPSQKSNPLPTFIFSKNYLARMRRSLLKWT
jgi:long-chain acyl-CoA synthetase